MKYDDLTPLEKQAAMLLFAIPAATMGLIVWVIQKYTGGPSWLPYVCGLIVFILMAARAAIEEYRKADFEKLKEKHRK